MSADALPNADFPGPGLESDRALLGRASMAERLADILRTRITEGYFEPGTRLSEKAIGTALKVSRNTLREAFRLLIHEHLLVHELNRGVFVRVLNAEDVADLYRLRKIVQCAAVRTVTEPPGDRLQPMEVAVEAGTDAAKRQDWQEMGTANLRFHEALTALAGSARADELMDGLLAELRLIFHVMGDPQRFHEPYLARNKEILEALRAGDGPAAERLLADYLDDAERQLLDAYGSKDHSSKDL